MKKYEELSKEEKDKLMIYWTIKGNLWIRYSIIAAVMYMGIFISLPVAMIPYFPLRIIGFYMLTAILLIALFLLVTVQRSLKYIQLAFGMEDSFEDIFDIKKTDIQNLKRRWIKVK